MQSVLGVQAPCDGKLLVVRDKSSLEPCEKPVIAWVYTTMPKVIFQMILLEKTERILIPVDTEKVHGMILFFQKLGWYVLCGKQKVSLIFSLIGLILDGFGGEQITHGKPANRCK